MQYLLSQLWGDIEHSITEPRIATGMAVMLFIGMQDKGFPWQAISIFPTIAKALHARQRPANGVSVMPMRVKTMGAEKCFQPLEF